MTYRSGECVAEYINDGDLDDKQIQPNGVDLTIGSLYKLDGQAVLTDRDYVKNDRIEVEPKTITGEDTEGLASELTVYPVRRLTPYVIQYGEIIEIPDNHVGFVYPRSRVMRCGAWLSTAVWDSGYRGKGEGGLIPLSGMDLEEDMRIAQIVFARTEELEQQYEGQHNGENL